MINKQLDTSSNIDTELDKILEQTGCTCYHESGCDKQDYIGQAKQSIKQLITSICEEVIGFDEETVIGRGVPAYTENLLRARQRQSLKDKLQ